ncbi:efflux RND transporter periplasmic adaptor subunit [endosymbiont of Riftia pachyptila]|uniref:Membrane-fusion protein n=1 Tax=endosymbiont of Riftia pachyptila (vent Ph05) TaxID=1048808 RepID=G2DD09_9GAMM|nr:HlyD family secretion protein [endosymbiont of Riftia pachyptila]EGV51498.1 membrane-fusion protein [endosymbiont of Riftia pachyptila (vent Ph05)]
MKKFFQKPFILPLIVIAALALVIFKVKSRPPIEHEELQFPTKTVEVITAKKIPFRSRAIAYGYVEPAVLLKAKTEVAGKISYIHPSLKKGASLAKGTVVLRIEPTTYEFSLDKSKAGLAGSQFSLKQLEVEEKTTQRSLKIAKKNLQTGQKELDRLLSIWEKRLISRSAVDAEEQKILQLRQQVEDLQGKLASFSSRKSATQAQIKQSKTQLAQSKDTLWRTEIRLPFDARIGKVSVEKGEYTAVGSVLFEALGTQAVEINAQLPVRQFYPLLMGLGKHSLNLQNPEDLQSAFSKIQLEANVSLVGYKGNIARWRGELLRIGESIDPDRDTIDLVVAVNNPYEDVIPGKRPPLLQGMYAAVEFFTPPHEMLILPRKAIHQGRVYVAKANNRLEIRPVNILHKQGQLVIVDNGIKEGEKIIITDVIPVIEGLPLKPVLADEYEKQLAKDAIGEEYMRLNDINENKVIGSGSLTSPHYLTEGDAE